MVGGSNPPAGSIYIMVGINKKLKGDTAELIVAAKFIADGFRVLFPYGENSRYDLVAEKNGKFFRVQVKYVTPKNGALEVNCRSSNNWSVIHYSKEDFDIIGVFDPIHGKIYFIPSKMVNNSTIRLRLEKSRNNQKKYVHYAEDYSKIPTF
ncbi:MAG: hypothetical protein COV41_02360 [Candidatus Brennerbacteria bacterium CG11_big_fil_rev_8_21_14_0_20_43_10]|uniref:PD(D/E)XK endonuclease domain-containing protein n=3 Tax=Candidatus Brenneribacteriota TaxID=1817902 RepID=A0A2M8C0P6_9BACT|nr:MAG: hypothetical protein COV41_02360 [Candidatus Brennerbacteria bacterium CG11_big_fil_rev_8_21_14_0_20_43_10]PIX28887.1 MAG: hypothetical protein COZ64_01620 [Candidatus Brennerbacteria bacterium CG_4_8_14_3_um_filter_43_14]PJB49696.1 MAG: hypothetical protein CO102_03250 [Candidatus Brennerbacteria bacterium CG_4_9_14_3_um_filter_43_9]